MTKNTKLFMVKYKDTEVQYRTLSVLELCYIDNINNTARKYEEAAKCAMIDSHDLPFQILQQIGKDILERSFKVINDKELFNLTVINKRNSIKEDQAFIMIMNILKVMPSVSIEYLYNCNYTDLIEISCLCETISNKYMFDVKSTQETTSNDGKTYFADKSDQSLQDKIKASQQYYK